jgi:hypothetical protein
MRMMYPKHYLSSNVYPMTPLDYTMLSLPAISAVVGWMKYRWDNTNNFTYGFFIGSLIALCLYAQTADSGLDWIKAS